MEECIDIVAHSITNLIIMKPIHLLILSCVVLSGCAAPQSYNLMPTPILYADSSIDPFAHLSREHKNTRTNIYYATNRVPNKDHTSTSYSNSSSPTLRFGIATVRIGDADISWEEMSHASLFPDPIKPIPVSVESIEEKGTSPQYINPTNTAISQELGNFFDLINNELATSVDREIMVYVHGTKVDFTNSAILAAEVEHFAGRDFVSLAFAWPSHQNIFSYLFGFDVHRAMNSSTALADVLALLAMHTNAEKINILSYSAGGRVASKAISELRQRFYTLDSDQLKEVFKIGSVVLAAADVEADVFLGRLKDLSELADQVVVTVSDKDNALQAAHKYMGGVVRAGTSDAEDLEMKYIADEELDNVSIVDVSIGQDHRGFDIVGHHYWYRHPWMSSEIVFIMRTDLPPQRRGLQPAESGGLWYLSSEYPHRVRAAAMRELGNQW